MPHKNQHGQMIGLPVENWSPREIPSCKVMQGKYCTLEALDIQKHGQGLFEAFTTNTDGETWTYLPFGPFETYKAFESWLAKASTQKIYYVVINHDNENLRPQGLTSYHSAEVEHGVIEVGSIHYSKLLQRTRATTDAMYLMMRYAFDDLGYRRYQWRCNTLNEASKKAATRLGFTFEGILRQTNVFKGYNRDTAWYSILNTEWPALKNKFERWLDPSNFDAQGKQKMKLQSL